MHNLKSIKEEIEKLKARNKKVELDKAWETSLSRKIIITILTYVLIVIFFFVAGLPRPFINSIVPTAGFVVSTLSLPLFKKAWIKLKEK